MQVEQSLSIGARCMGQSTELTIPNSQELFDTINLNETEFLYLREMVMPPFCSGQRKFLDMHRCAQPGRLALKKLSDTGKLRVRKGGR